MTNKHTLNTPWRIVSMGNAKFPDAITIEDCKGGFPLVKDNSQEIVRVVNSHDALLEALEDVVKGYQMHFDSMPMGFQSFINIAEQAINKAKGL